MVFARTFVAAAALATLAPGLAQAAPSGLSNRDIAEEAFERMRAADANRDGTITRQELISHRAAEWPRLDRNGDNYFSKDDLPRFARSRWDGGRLATLRETYDSDRDDRISRAEFLSGPTTAYDLADRNRDNRVTSAEIDTAIAELKRT